LLERPDHQLDPIDERCEAIAPSNLLGFGRLLNRSLHQDPAQHEYHIRSVSSRTSYETRFPYDIPPQFIKVYKAMTRDEFRCEMDRHRRAVHEEADQFKYPYLALKRLYALYEKFDAEERAMADEVVTDWILSDDPNVRFDALALAREFHISNAIPALEKLAKRLPSTCTPGALYELEKVNRIMSTLTAG
jgi:hypothetical protein